ncbi:LLM class flavin-dependent oxidoreductase [Paenibacillus endoradicis]|uniref:LLM class flavin-dependent oxidoreductase n=1 Tax=Paenibacillus endoradicis TaxID=2972487 RepID=UPI0021598EF4|nr:LLM class flavin-dependent oxidoreductase [Paenibacillus endoradicis]MCR8660054.1 LLM class flavin-dependent oxidoreductase [Paenibacillus endoradicis]
MSNKQKVELGWFIPTTGDGEFIGIAPERPASPQYLTDVAKAAEAAGYEFALIPAGGECWDGFIVGSWIAAQTTKLKSLVALRPGLISPVLAARTAATLDQMSGGRVMMNVVTGHYPQDLKACGDPLYDQHDQRYERTQEFLEVVRGVWGHGGRNAEGFNYEGKHYFVEGGTCQPAAHQQPHPPIYFGGSSVAGKKTAAKTADVYLMWAEPVAWIKEQIAEMEGFLQEQREQEGLDRNLRYGMRAQLVVRETEEEAWDAAWRILSKADPEQVQSKEKLHAKTDAVGQERQMELFRQSEENKFVIAPNMWSGLSAIRGGGAVAFVGTPQQVTERILEFVDVGVTSFILSGYPHLEEAEITGRLLMPVLKAELAKRGL